MLFMSKAAEFLLVSEASFQQDLKLHCTSNRTHNTHQILQLNRNKQKYR